jgi:RHS repeat-associated protein
MTLTAAGSPYTGNSVSVNSGVTLTVEPGAVVKLWSLDINGTLDVNGSSGSPAVFTSSSDSAPGQWLGISLNASASSIDHAVVRYANNNAITIAQGGTASITNSEITQTQFTGISSYRADPTVSGNHVHSNGGVGMNFAGGAPEIYENTVEDNAAGLTSWGGGINYEICNCSSITGEIDIHDNVVEDNGGMAGIAVHTGFSGLVTGTSIGNNEIRDNDGKGLSYLAQAAWDNQIPPDISTNTIEGNGQDGVWVAGDVATSTTWTSSNYAFVLQGRMDIQTGVTLELDPGFVLKASCCADFFQVQGELLAVGEPGNPITFTSDKDDSVAGDTNGDGAATAPAPGDWGSIHVGIGVGSGTSAATFDRASFRYGGRQPQFGTIDITCGNPGPGNPCASLPPIQHSKFVNNRTAVKVSGNAGQGPVLTRNLFRGNELSIQKIGSDALEAPDNDSGCKGGPANCTGANGLSGNVAYTEDSPGDDCNGQRLIDPIYGGLGALLGGEKPAQEGGGETKCEPGADPVVLATGGLVYSHTDLRLTNKTPRPLELTRTYNSLDPVDSGFGPGWSHSGLVTVSEKESGDVLVLWGHGRGDLFNEDAGSYEPPDGIHDVLEQELDGTFKLTTQEGAVYVFDEANQLVSHTDDHGQITSYAYSGGRLTTITDPSGQSLTFGYDAAGKIGEVSDSTGREVTYTYTADGDLDTVTDPLNGVTDYAYDSQRRLKSIKDPRDVTYLENVYDGQDRVIEQTDGEGNVWTLAYEEGQTEVTEPEGGTTTYLFDELRRTESKTNQLGHTTSYTYDDRGNVETETRPGGAVWTYDYDAAGNMTSAIDPMGGEREMTYDGSNQLTSYTDPRDQNWTFDWTGRDMTLITDPLDGETELTYNAAGQLLTVTDPNNHTTTYTYDGAGNLTSVTDPLSHATTYGYNPRGFLTSVTEPGKDPETYTRNALGDLLSRTTPEGHETSYDYDENGALIGVVDPALNEWTIERDGMERPISYTDPLDQETSVTYNDNLNPVTVTDRRNETTTYTYDLSNQLTSVERPEGGTWELSYDARGNRDEVTNPRENTTTYEFDLNDRMTEANEPLSTTTAYGYDSADNMTSITDPRSNVTEFSYDELGRMSAIEQPLGKITGFLYDPAGNLVSRITAEDALVYDYDGADRLLEVNDGTDVLRSFAYDDADRLTEATDAQSKTLEIGYDDDDNVIALDDDRGQAVARDFDSRGNLVESIDGRGTVQYAWDELNRMDSLTDPDLDEIGFAYDPEGNLTETELPNGVTTTNTFDGDGRMTSTSSEDTTPSVLQAFDYTYDAAGNRISQTDRNDDETTYVYDALDRLTEFDPPAGPAVSYGYDHAGNRTSAGGITSTFNELNQLTSSSDGTSYDYDDAGRLIERDNGITTTAYAWDPLDQLVQVDNGTDAIAYDYDALGRRSERSDGVAVTTAHYGDLSDNANLDTDATPSVIKSWLQGPAGLVEQTVGTTTSYPLSDAHGDITTVTDGSGGASARHEFDPWGAQTAGPHAEMGWLGSHQRRADQLTGLVQMGARHVDPLSGAFLSEDVVLGRHGVGQSLNRYGYGWSNPIGLFDLDGRSVCDGAGDVPGIGGILGERCEGVEDGVDAVGDAADDIWDASAGSRTWVGDRLYDFYKAYDDAADCLSKVVGETLEDPFYTDECFPEVPDDPLDTDEEPQDPDDPVPPGAPGKGPKRVEP